MLARLREALGTLPPGQYSPAAPVISCLVGAWPELYGSAAGDMDREKLVDRVTDVGWDPPVLSFGVRRERGHGRGEFLQGWQVDVQDGTAWMPRDRPRALPTKRDAAELARELVRDLSAGRGSCAVVRKSSGGVAIRPGEVAGLEVGFAETLPGRHHRFRAALERAMADAGFVKVGPYRFRPGE